MYIVLLSGGSGKRLWPLSNDSYSKQYIKLMDHDDLSNEEKCSMLQRVYGQLKSVGLSENTIVCASDAQVELIESQLDGQAEVAVEPMRRDTFPAVMLSCAYLLSKKGAKEEDVVAFLPVDPYTTRGFFDRIKKLGDDIEQLEDTIGLLGGVPTYPSAKYGYIIPEKSEAELLKVEGFREKPDEAAARQLVREGALWNCGVFCFKLSMASQWIKKYDVIMDYDFMVEHYERLPKKSFDYEVLEHWKNTVAIKYNDLWKDLGTWNTLTEEMKEQSIGDVTWDDTCENTHAINVLDIPLVVMGAKNMVIAASHDGILVADKHQSSYIKDCLEDIGDRSRYEERRWGTIKTIDAADEDGVQSVTNRVKVMANKGTSYHRHLRHDENIVIISGRGMLKIGDKYHELVPGEAFYIKMGTYHGIKAISTDLKYIETLIGDLNEDDVERVSIEWN